MLQGQLSLEKYENIIHVLENWTSEDKDIRTAYRSKNRDGYKLARLYDLRISALPQGGGRLTTLIRKGQNPRIMLPETAIFDAIWDAHHAHGHMKLAVTWNSIRTKYANVTQAQVKQFITMCPVCNEEQPRLETLKGAKKPITSEEFRSRFQVDLIDKRSKAMRNLYGVKMRWILCLKDHLTGLCYLAAIPQKRPVFVAKELAHVFGLIGFPRILHTDNGNEFTAHVSTLVVLFNNKSNLIIWFCF